MISFRLSHNTRRKKQTMKKLISFVLVFCMMMMTLCTINVHGAEPDRVDPNSTDFYAFESQKCIDDDYLIGFADTPETKVKESEPIDLFAAEPADPDAPEYVEGEVLICLANTPETRELSFSSVYSDDYKRINKKARAGQVAAEPIQSIEKQLDLDLDITEMRLLNPSIERGEDGKFWLNEKHNSMFLLKIKGETVEEAIEKLSENPNILYAEPNHVMHLFSTPNDPYYNVQYALTNMNLPQAWNTTTGSRNVVVGIIDTGIDGTHPDLVDNLWDNPYYVEGTGCSICNQCGLSYQNDLHGYDFTGTSSNSNPTDPGGHGTLVSGVVGAKGNNSIGVCGGNWNVSLAWLGVYDPSSDVDTSLAAEAINYAENHGIMIVNCSFGGWVENRLLKTAISNYSGLVVCAAGNDGRDVGRYSVFPASSDCPNILAVAATDENNDLASYSNYGEIDVDVAAPGSDIYTTKKNGGYRYANGTSMASPQVAGIAALVKAAHPNYTAQQIKAAICGTVQQLGKTYHIANDGGIVDAAAAVSVSSSSLKKVTFHFNYPGAAPSTFEDYVYYGHKYGYPPEATTIFSALSDPNLPNSGEYVFDGWYTTASAVTPFNFNNPVYSNKNVYAKWVSAPENSYGKELPDYRFRKEILNIVNAHDGGTRTASSIVANDTSYLESITALDVSNKEIISLKGIERLSGLQSLNCSHNRIRTIPVSDLSNVEELNCSYNRIIALSLSSLNVRVLDCSHNGQFLTLTLNDEIQYLDCSYNYLILINNSNGNPQYIDCSNNALSSFTTKNNLEYLNCNNNEISSLNVNASTGLETLNCAGNQLTSIGFGNSNPRYLNCSQNSLTALTTKSNLEYLNCNNNEISSLNVNASTGLETLYCAGNQLTSIDFGNSNPRYLNCSQNSLTTLTTKSNLKRLNCNDNMIERLNVQGSTGLDTLYCKSNRLYTINTLGLSDLGNVDVSYNQMSSKSDVIGYTHWDYPAGVFYNQFNPQQPWSQNWCTDVSDSTYYYKAVEYVLSNGYMSTTANLFRPNATMTRLELAVTLYKMAGKPSVSGLSVPFTDISNLSSDELKAVKWNYNNGNQVIMGGTSGTLFSPSIPATRETVAVVLTRYATRMNVTLTKIRDYVPFTDDAQISNWARASIVTLYEAGILNGSSGYYYPKTNIIRGDVAVFVRKFKVIPQYLS